MTCRAPGWVSICTRWQEWSYPSTDDVDVTTPACSVLQLDGVHNTTGCRRRRAARHRWWRSPGVSGSGKSSLAFRHHLCRGAAPLLRVRWRPYARRLLLSTGGARRSTSITRRAARRGAAAAAGVGRLRGRRWAPSPPCRSCCGCCPLRAARSRAGSRATGLRRRSPRTPPSAPARSATGSAGSTGSPRETLVPDPSLTIREGAVAAWPGAWRRPEPARHPRHALATTSTRRGAGCRRRQRDWILFTDEQPTGRDRSRASTPSAPTTTTTAPSPAPNATSATRWPTRRAR